MKTKYPLYDFTVIGYIDGDYSVETFVEHVRATSRSGAWDAAIKQLRKDKALGAYDRCDVNNATEIATFAGKLYDAYAVPDHDPALAAKQREVEVLQIVSSEKVQS